MNLLDLPPDEPTTAEELRVRTRRVLALRKASRRPRVSAKEAQPSPPPPGPISKHAPIVKERRPMRPPPEPPSELPNFLALVRFESEPIINISMILHAVAAYFKITLNDLMSDRRSWSISHPRQIGMYLARKLTRNSLPQIGRKFGGKDHTTVLMAIRRVEARIEAHDETTATAVLEIERRLTA